VQFLLYYIIEAGGANCFLTCCSRTASTDLCLDRFFWATQFLFFDFFLIFFVSVPGARLSWPSHQLLSARQSTVSYHSWFSSTASDLLTPLIVTYWHCVEKEGSQLGWIVWTSVSSKTVRLRRPCMYICTTWHYASMLFAIAQCTSVCLSQVGVLHRIMQALLDSLLLLKIESTFWQMYCFYCHCTFY